MDHTQLGGCAVGTRSDGYTVDHAHIDGDARDVVNLAWSIVKIGRLLTRHLSDAAGLDDLSTQQWRILTELSSGDPDRSVRHLRRLLDATPAWMTASCDELERAGLVTRHRDASDRRVVHLRLTEAGLERVAAKQRAVYRAAAPVLSDLDAADRAMLLSLLGRLAPHLPAADPARRAAA